MVSVRRIAEALENGTHPTYAYDRETDDLVLTNQDADGVFAVGDGSGRFVVLETDFDLERRIMEDFIETITDDALAMRFDAIISCSDAEDRFLRMVGECRLEKTWRAFRRERYISEAKTFCECNDIRF